jgi:hypothetical protein
MSANNLISTNINGTLNVLHYRPKSGGLYPATPGNAYIQGALTVDTLQGTNATLPVKVFTTPTSGGLTLGESTTPLTVNSPTLMSAGITTASINSLQAGDPSNPHSNILTLNGYVKAENFQSKGFTIGDYHYGSTLDILQIGGSPENYRIEYSTSGGPHSFVSPVIVNDGLTVRSIEPVTIDPNNPPPNQNISLFTTGNAVTPITLGNADCPITINSPVTFTSNQSISQSSISTDQITPKTAGYITLYSLPAYNLGQTKYTKLGIDTAGNSWIGSNSDSIYFKTNAGTSDYAVISNSGSTFNTGILCPTYNSKLAASYIGGAFSNTYTFSLASNNGSAVFQKLNGMTTGRWLLNITLYFSYTSYPVSGYLFQYGICGNTSTQSPNVWSYPTNPSYSIFTIQSRDYNITVPAVDIAVPGGTVDVYNGLIVTNSFSYTFDSVDWKNYNNNTFVGLIVPPNMTYPNALNISVVGTRVA